VVCPEGWSGTECEVCDEGREGSGHGGDPLSAVFREAGEVLADGGAGDVRGDLRWGETAGIDEQGRVAHAADGVGDERVFVAFAVERTEDGDGGHDQQNDRITPGCAQFGHPFEVHAVNAHYERQRHKDGAEYREDPHDLVGFLVQGTQIQRFYRIQ
jgi:hypothetical protein